MIEWILAAGLLLSQPPPSQSALDAARAEVVKAGLKFAVSADDPNVIARYVAETRTVHVNAAHRHWRDPAGYMKADYVRHALSSPAPNHVVRHEMAHAEMHRKIGLARMGLLCHQPAPLARDRVIAAVSTYAATSAAEFYAEVHAGLKAGIKFPADVMDAFRGLVK